MKEQNLLTFTGKSIYCPAADLHIDPWQQVERAVITHAHSDHARWGCKHYLVHKDSEAILRMRLGETISLQTVEYGETFSINGVQFSLHPAGHIIGSAQVRVEQNDQVWVASGDYKLQNDLFCSPFEAVKCHTFITESTFGLPIYKWQPQQEVINDIKAWCLQNKLQGKNSVLMGYALGKMQRLIKNLQPFDQPVFAHGAIYNVNEKLRAAGFDLPYIPPVSETDKKAFQGALILATGSALNTPWLKRFEPYATGYCSGWMAIRGAKNRKAIDRGFVLSDHADWNELNTAISATGAEKIYVTHGYTDIFSQWLNEQGIEAAEVKTMYGEDEAEESRDSENL
jgi:putative mRNA 3-end processing factor